MINYEWFGAYVAVNVLIVTLLALNVSYKRIKLGVANGDADNREMKKTIRAHGNSVEHISIFGLVVLALAVIQSAPVVQCVLVVLFTLGRVLHAYGMLSSMFNVRRVAIVMTYCAELSGVLALIYYLI